MFPFNFSTPKVCNGLPQKSSRCQRPIWSSVAPHPRFLSSAEDQVAVGWQDSKHPPLLLCSLRHLSFGDSKMDLVHLEVLQHRPYASEQELHHQNSEAGSGELPGRLGPERILVLCLGPVRGCSLLHRPGIWLRHRVCFVSLSCEFLVF